MGRALGGDALEVGARVVFARSRGFDLGACGGLRYEADRSRIGGTVGPPGGRNLGGLGPEVGGAGAALSARKY